MSKSRWAFISGCISAAVALFVMFLVATPTFAQESGTILGVVKDTSGGTIPAAKITVTNAGTNESRTATTGDDGAYRVPGLVPGTYTVRIEKDGFKSSTQTALTLDVAAQLVVNPVMEVGAASQEVTVTGEAPLVNTTTSSLGGLVNDQRIADLPLNGRNYIDLTLLQPGVQQNTNPPGGGSGAAGTWYSSNGSPPRSNNYVMDGGLLSNQYATGTNSIGGTTLGVDGIKEYKVITTNFSAEYGMTMGSQMVIVSKSGTNNWHGDAFEYLRNSHLDARNFFDTGYQTPGAPRLPEFQRNNFGGSGGGPIQKDKTFAYLVYEGLRERVGATITDTEPNAACHNLVPAGTSGMGVVGTVDIAQANPLFPNGANIDNPTDAFLCGATGVTDTTVIPGVVQPWLGQLPLPLAGSGSTNNYTYPAQFKIREDYSQLRVDHHFGDNDSAFSRYTFDDSIVHSPLANIQTLTTGAALPQWNTIGKSRNQWVTFGEDHILSPVLLNSVRLSFGRTNFSVAPEAEVTPLNPFGALIGANWSAVPGYGGNWAPTGFQGPSYLGSSPIGPASSRGSYHIQNVWTLADDMFLTHGKNAFKFGFLGNDFEEPNLTAKGLAGGLTFSNLAQFMEGTPSSISALVTPYPGFSVGCPNAATLGTSACVLSGNLQLLPPYNGNSPDRDYMFKTLGFYLQDDYRMTSRLTLNLGLRYEFSTPWHELYGRESALLDIQHASATQTGLQIDDPTYLNFSPRVGFAWDVFGTGKTSVRSGFGMYYDVGNEGSLQGQAPTGFPPFSAQTSYSFSPVGSYTVTSLPIPYSTIVPASSFGRNLQGNTFFMGQPYSIQYNLTVEQQLPGGIGLSVSYVGSRGIHLITGEEGNPVIPLGFNIAGVNEPVTVVGGTPQLPNNWQTGIPYYPVSTPVPGEVGGGYGASPTNGTGGCFNNALNPSFPNQTFAAGGYPCRINPYWGSYEYYSSAAESWYNSLQVVATKRLSHGLDFQAAYTYSNSEDDTSGQQYADDCAQAGSAVGQNPGNLRLDKGLSCSSAPNSFHFNALYTFPTIKSDGALSKAVNGWRVSSIVTIQQGFPQTATVAVQRSFSGIIAQAHADDLSLNTTSGTVTYPVGAAPAGATIAPNCSATPTPTCTYTLTPYNPSTVVTGNPAEWFNVGMFAEAPLGRLGNVGRDTLPGPSDRNWDFSVVKDTRLGFLGEAGNLEFRVEFFNILNHVNFGTPGTAPFSGTSCYAASSSCPTSPTAAVNTIDSPNGGFIQAPNGATTSSPFGTGDEVTTTRTTSRQVQLALKVIF